MVAGRLPILEENHSETIAETPLDIANLIDSLRLKLGNKFPIHVGINTEPVVREVIEKKKLIYTLWGDWFHVASLMESQGILGCIKVTIATYECLKHMYKLELQGKVAIKGKGQCVPISLLAKIVIKKNSCSLFTV